MAPWLYKGIDQGRLVAGTDTRLCDTGEGKQAFHVVAPSLPGFAFSSAPKQKGFGVKQIAKTFNQLMLELGYDKYVSQGVSALSNALQPSITARPTVSFVGACRQFCMLYDMRVAALMLMPFLTPLLCWDSMFHLGAMPNP